MAEGSKYSGEAEAAPDFGRREAGLGKRGDGFCGTCERAPDSPPLGKSFLRQCMQPARGEGHIRFDLLRPHHSPSETSRTRSCTLPIYGQEAVAETRLRPHRFLSHCLPNRTLIQLISSTMSSLSEVGLLELVLLWVRNRPAPMCYSLNPKAVLEVRG